MAAVYPPQSNGALAGNGVARTWLGIRNFWWALALTMLFGGALRLAHINHKVYHIDEQVAQAVVAGLEFPRQWDTNWIKTEVGSGFKYDQYNFSSYHYLLFFWGKGVSFFGNGVGQLGAMRMFNLLFGLIYIGALAMAGKKWGGELAGIAAAIAGAVLPLWVEEAHYLRSESMLTAGVAVLLGLAAGRGPRIRWPLFLGGLIIGWMVACKATMGLALPLLLIPLVDHSLAQKNPKKVFGVLSGIVGLGFIVGVVGGVPYGVAQPQLYFSSLARLAHEYSSPMPPYTQPDMGPSLPMALAYLKGTLGWGFWAVALFGLFCVGKANVWWRTALFVAPLLVALMIFGSHPLFTERSYSPFLPVAVVLFSVGCQAFAEIVTLQSWFPRSFRIAVFAVSLVITLALPAIYTWQLVFQVFSGKEQVDKDDALSQMKGNRQGKLVRMFNVSYYAANYSTIDTMVENGDAVLVLVVDYYDVITPTCLSSLRDRYEAQTLGVRESIFPGLPACMLNTIISPRLWLLYIPAKGR